MMIQKLKVECGAATVGKISQMMKDIQLSEAIQTEFQSNNGGNNLVGATEFSIEVLSNGTWPAFEPPPLELPQELKSCADKFTLWYKNANSNKQLTWLYSNGSVEIGLLFTDKKYILTCNVFQASILCLFNSDIADISCRDIMQQSNMPKENFTGAMMKLCDPKIKILLKEVNKPVFGENEKIKVNPKFASKMIKMNIIPVKTFKKKTVELSAEEQAERT